MKKFWKWTNRIVKNEETKEQTPERTLFLNGTIADESWFDDDITPQLFKEELLSGNGDITVWINSPGGDCVAAAQIYNMLMDYHGNVEKPPHIQTRLSQTTQDPLSSHVNTSTTRTCRRSRFPVP